MVETVLLEVYYCYCWFEPPSEATFEIECSCICINSLHISKFLLIPDVIWLMPPLFWKCCKYNDPIYNLYQSTTLWWEILNLSVVHFSSLHHPGITLACPAVLSWEVSLLKWMTYKSEEAMDIKIEHICVSAMLLMDSCYKLGSFILNIVWVYLNNLGVYTSIQSLR